MTSSAAPGRWTNGTHCGHSHTNRCRKEGYQRWPPACGAQVARAGFPGAYPHEQPPRRRGRQREVAGRPCDAEPSPIQKTPNAVTITPTHVLHRVLRNARERAVHDRAERQDGDQRHERAAGGCAERFAGSAPERETIATTSIPSVSTPLNAVAKSAAPLSRSRASRSRANAAFSSRSALRPAARSTALRNHVTPT